MNPIDELFLLKKLVLSQNSKERLLVIIVEVSFVDDDVLKIIKKDLSVATEKQAIEMKSLP